MNALPVYQKHVFLEVHKKSGLPTDYLKGCGITDRAKVA